MNQEANLASLSRPASSPGGKKKDLGSLLLLAAFLAGVALVFILVFGNRLVPRVPVSVVPALLLESDDATAAPAPGGTGPMLAQASGWIEPDPFPVRVPVKVDGFVEEVLVYEGDTVRQGQLLATLDATNHRLLVERLTASLDEARAMETMREQSIDQALHDRTASEAAKRTAMARYSEAQDRLERIRDLELGNVSEVEVIAAERAEIEARASLDEAIARLARSGSVVESSRTGLAQQQARVAALEAEVRQATVDLARTKVTAPMNGMVLRRFAAPGMKRMARMDDPDSATIVSLYDPEHLQVRVDVPLSDAGRMVTGMPARVMTAGLDGQVFTGRVTRIVGQADITRNTLQVKVALADGNHILRPEMLCRVEFFAPPTGTAGTSGRTRRIWLPGAALEDDAAGATTVWVVDSVNETVSLREIEVASRDQDGMRLVYRGLRPGEQVVLTTEGWLEPGTRVSINKD